MKWQEFFGVSTSDEEALKEAYLKKLQSVDKSDTDKLNEIQQKYTEAQEYYKLLKQLKVLQDNERNKNDVNRQEDVTQSSKVGFKKFDKPVIESPLERKLTFREYRCLQKTLKSELRRYCYGYEPIDEAQATIMYFLRYKNNSFYRYFFIRLICGYDDAELRKWMLSLSQWNEHQRKQICKRRRILQQKVKRKIIKTPFYMKVYPSLRGSIFIRHEKLIIFLSLMFIIGGIIQLVDPRYKIKFEKPVSDSQEREKKSALYQARYKEAEEVYQKKKQTTKSPSSALIIKVTTCTIQFPSEYSYGKKQIENTEEYRKQNEYDKCYDVYDKNGEDKNE